MARKDYLAIAKQRVTRPSLMKVRRIVLVYSRNKKGKSTFAASGGRDNTLMVDPEQGTKEMLKVDPWVWPIEKWADLDEVAKALRTGKLSPNHLQQGESSTPFSIVALDGLTKFNNMALKFVMKKQELADLTRQPGFVQQRDYGKSGELMKTMFMQFFALKSHLVMTVQERMIVGAEGWAEDDSDAEGNDDEAVSFVPDLPKGVRADANALADVIGRLYVRKVEVNGKEKQERRLYVGPSEGYDTGYRSDFELPDTIRRPTLPKLFKLMSEGNVK